MIKVLSLVKPYKKSIYIALFLMLIELIVELWHPLLMAKIIDEGIVKRDLSIVITWGGVMIALTIIAFGAGVLNSFYAASVSQGFGYDVRNRLFDKIQAFSFSNLSRFPTSFLITRLTNDITQLQNLVFMGLRIMVRAPLLVIGSITMALIVNWQLALILVVTMPVLLLIMMWLMKKGVKLFQSVQEKLDAVNSVMRENLTGMRLIKAFLRKKHEQNRFAKASQELKDKTIGALRLLELTMPVLLLVMNISILFILWFGSSYFMNNKIDIGEVVAIINYATRMMFAFSVFSFILMNLARAKASANRIAEVLDEDIDLIDGEEITSRQVEFLGKIKFDHVSFQYPNSNLEVLKDISFEIKAGEMVAILGATGSGKTSLFQLIPRLYDATNGTIMIDEQQIKNMKLDVLRKQIGYVPQDSRLFSGTIVENIRWGKENSSMDEIIEAAKAAQIHETIMKLPLQYETVIGQKGVNLSGGQKQRLSIARALIRKPKILLLDDSTSALDLQTERKIIDAIKQLSCTTLIITQKISTVIAAEKIIFLDDGELIAEGDHQKLLQTTTLYKKVHDSQFSEGGIKHV